MNQRLKPQSLEAEQSTLGACLMERRALEITRDELNSPDAFYRELHQKIYRVLIEMNDKGATIDFVTVAQELRNRGQLDEIGGSEYLTALIEACPSAVNVKSYLAVVVEKWTRRQMLAAADRMVGAALDEETPIGAAVEIGQQAAMGVAVGGRDASELRALDELLLPAFGALMNQMERKGGVTGTPTGFADVDRLLCGLQPATLTILGARPKMGKSSLAMQIALNVAKAGAPVAVFSLEMSRNQLVERMICSEAGVDSQDYRRGFLDDAGQGRVARAFGELRGVPLHIEDGRNLTSRDIAARARRLASRGPLGLIVVDYLQLVAATNERAPRHEQVSEIARALSSLASELGCPVLALSQLSRKVEEREDKRPIMSDLRESGSLEAEAHVVMFLYREAYYARKKDGQEDAPPMTELESAELIVAAHRAGPTGVAMLGWQGEFVRFVNHAPEPTNDYGYGGNN